MEFLDQILGLDTTDAVTRIGIIVVILVLTWLTQYVLRYLLLKIIKLILQAANIIRKAEPQLEAQLSQALIRPIQLLVICTGFKVLVDFVSLSGEILLVVNQLINSLVVMALFWGLLRIFDIMTKWYIQKSVVGQHTIDETMVRFLRQLAMTIIILLPFTVVLQQWGIDVGALIAGLGVASLAIALAAQDALGNIIAYFAILIDAPFKVGNFIVISPDLSGTVEEISFRSTRIRTKDHALVVVPNRTVANANITNWTRIHKRRFEANFNINNDLSYDILQDLKQAIYEMLNHHELVTKDQIVVEFVKFDGTAFTMLVACSVKATVWEDSQRVKTDLNLKIASILQDKTRPSISTN